MDIALLLIGVAMLAGGGEALIRGSLATAARLGISPLLSGLIIVGFGTSAPELVVSVDAAVNERPDLALGNVVGSNIGNVLLILGTCAVIRPLAVHPSALHRDALSVVLASILFIVLVGGNALTRTDAAMLLTCLAAYLVWAYLTERSRDSPQSELHRAEASELSFLPQSLLWTTVAMAGGLLLLIAGSQALLRGAIGLAEYLGISEAAIGVTLVAVGTSLPELAISVIAAIRRHADVAVGNILGSNIFNVLGILGISALLQPLPVHTRILQFDQWVMLGTSLLLLLFLYTGRRIGRLEGGVLLGCYGAYVWLSFVAYGT